jgi:anaerobic magnesium-protoporphyrin IX monomethyl ester cyclase
MKIMLIDPPYTIFTGYDSRYFPVGLSYVGSVLKDNGYDVVIYDVDRERQDTGNLNFSKEYQRLENYRKEINSGSHFIWRRIAEVVQDYAPDTVGITSMTMKFGSVVKTAEICKKIKPDSIVVIGEPHATDWPEICFKSSYIGFCISGKVMKILLMSLN